MRAAAGAALTSTGMEIVEAAKNNITAYAPALHDTGTLRRAIGIGKVEDTPQGPRLAVGIKTKAAAVYAMVMEYGRRAGAKQPPAEALMPWVRRRIKPKQEMSKARKVARRGMGKSGKQLESARAKDDLIRSVAFLVARSIKRKGIRPRPFLMPAFAKHKANVLPRYKAALEAEIKKRGLDRGQ